MSDTLLILNLLSVGDWQGAYVEALRLKNGYFMAKSVALKGDTSKAIMILSDAKTCREKRFKLALAVSKFLI